MTMYRFALLGAGFIGSVHAANLASHPKIDFTLIYDIDSVRADRLATEHGAQATDDLESAFDPDRVDAVFIASSTDTHADHLRRAADAGIAVLCEKPIDLDLDRATDAARYAQRHNIRAMVDFNRRFDRDYAQLKGAVDAGEIGDIALVQLTSRGPAMPPLDYIAVSGGQLRDQTIHFFDLARWISGQDPAEVYATGTALAEPRLVEYGDIDTSVATLRLPSGAIVQIDCTRRTGYGYDERIEVLGSNGMIEARRQRTGSVSRYRAGQVIDDGLYPGWFERVQPTYAAALDYFVRSLDQDGQITPSLDDGLKAQAIAEAATRSLTSNRSEPIRYSEPS
jgi:myo-inositol 2-dehydrogenase / D-chiro-inositol 1-dehydrogenase